LSDAKKHLEENNPFMLRTAMEDKLNLISEAYLEPPFKGSLR
jgi:hypothetical protein